jgi:DNA-binding transcriptional regulator YhcF (GntR family)
LLDEAGLISTQQGRGTYIWTAPDEEAARKLRQESLEGLAQSFLARAARLGYTPDEVTAAFEQEINHWRTGRLQPEEGN